MSPIHTDTFAAWSDLQKRGAATKPHPQAARVATAWSIRACRRSRRPRRCYTTRRGPFGGSCCPELLLPVPPNSKRPGFCDN